MAGNEGMRGQGKKEAAEAAGGAGSAYGASGWLETKPFLSGGEEPPLTPRALGGGEKVKEGAARVVSHAATAPQGRLGKLGALLAAHGFLAGAAIVVSVVAFGVTGVALLNSTGKTMDDDEVATVGLGGGDKDPDGSTTTTVPGRPGVAGDATGKTTLPPETTAPSTTTTRPTATTRPVVVPTEPPPTDPPPTEPPPPPAPTVSLDANQRGYCQDRKYRVVDFSWSTSEATSATFGRAGSTPEAVGTSGSRTMCAEIRGTYTLTATGPGGTQSQSVEITQP